MTKAFDLGVFGIKNTEKGYFYPPFYAHDREHAAALIAERLVRDKSFSAEMDGPFVLVQFGTFTECTKKNPFNLFDDPVVLFEINELRLDSLIGGDFDE